jgi:hypothetical protein
MIPPEFRDDAFGAAAQNASAFHIARIRACGTNFVAHLGVAYAWHMIGIWDRCSTDNRRDPLKVEHRQGAGGAARPRPTGIRACGSKPCPVGLARSDHRSSGKGPRRIASSPPQLAYKRRLDTARPGAAAAWLSERAPMASVSRSTSSRSASLVCITREVFQLRRTLYDRC